MPQLKDDLSKSLVALDQNRTLVAVVQLLNSANQVCIPRYCDFIR
jgi:hypothetical protein